MDFWARLEGVRARWNVLEHPFYQRWSEGALTRTELAAYAGQYRHAVVALAEASAATAAAADAPARPELDAHAAEEAGHVALWDAFASAVGAPAHAAATQETDACAHAWARRNRTLLEGLVALYTIESGQPAIAEVKAAGLRERYGFDGPPATEYFDVHARRDREHAAAGRALIEPRLPEADADTLLAEAEAVLRANWELLDGVERINGG